MDWLASRRFSDSFSRLLELWKGGVSVDMSMAKLDHPAFSVEGIISGETLGTRYYIIARRLTHNRPWNDRRTKMRS
jgi:hypothetical protein